MRLIAHCFLLSSVSCYYIAIDQKSAPFLKTWDGRAVDWSTGPVAALTDTSMALRVSSRGMHFYDHGVQPLGEGHFCKRSAVALCEMDTGSLVFPEIDMPRYSYGVSRCGTESASRVVVSNSSIYDISVCDLFQGQLDVIYWKGKLHFDFNLYLPEWAYILTAIAVLFLVISLGQNIARTMGDQQAVTMPWVTEFVCLAQVVLILSLHNPLRIFVADHDRAMLVVILAYIATYWLRHLLDMYLDRHVYTFNIITGTLILVTARLYCSFETPYTTVFLVLLLTRMSHKLQMQNQSPWTKLTTVADAILVALHYRYSFRSSFWDPQTAPIYTAAIVTICYVVGSVTATKA
jgi:hypothetical protein